MVNKILWIMLLLTACKGGYGNSVGGEEFTVYFPDPKDENIATEIAKYWKDNDLLSGKQQDIQLISEGNDYRLLIIARDPRNLEMLSFQEQKLFYGLKDSLQQFVCDSCNLSIDLCDNKFEPKYRIE